jgi:protoheme IX farnesyltransferase
MKALAAEAVVAVPAVAARSRALDYLELTKPRVAVLVLFTVAAGYLLGGGATVSVVVLFHTLLGTALVAAGACALNQWMERRIDSRMPRTLNRPLPAGRLHSVEALAFGILLGVVGVVYLVATLPHPGAAVVAAITLVSYVAVYTPMKPLTTANTLVGAVPGALPPLIGWVAATGSIDARGVALFAILYYWQIPHFLAIAWIYRDDYAAGGLRMLPVVDPDGRLTGRCMVLFCIGLVAASLCPFLVMAVGQLYLIGGLLLGLWFLEKTLRFMAQPAVPEARQVLYASLVYLPGLLGLLVIDAALPRLFR